MPEPTTVTAASIAAAVSAVSLALFGVDYYSMLYALVGALFSLGQAESMSRLRAVVYVVLSTLAGAAIGNVVQDYLALKGRGSLIGFCLVGGIIAQFVASALVQAAPQFVAALVRRFGGRDAS